MSAVTQWFARFADMDYVALLTAVVDVALVAFVIYKLITLAKGTRAWQILWGLGVFLLAFKLSGMFHLRALNSLLRIFIPLGPVALVILFYPELRNALEEVGRLRFLNRGFVMLAREDISNLIDQLVRAVEEMSRASVGALIVIEREVGLDNIISNGRPVDAIVSADLLRTIFHPGSPLHDGAVIIRGNRVVAASCTLPLSDSTTIGTMIHTRHKAALGVSEESDAVVVVVSEETGLISLSVEGNLLRGLQPNQLRSKLSELLEAPSGRESVMQIKQTMSKALSRVRSGGSSNEKPEC